MIDKPKMIRFITSDYKELFQIPDGGSIKITYPPGDGREPVTRACRYRDDHHFETLGKGGDMYHICQFAEIMERIGARYEPEVQLRDAVLTPFRPGEEKFYTYNREEGNTCVGHISGDFGNDGERFHGGWRNHKTRSEQDWNGTSSEFQTELHSAVYALRQDLLKDNDSMASYCENHPEALIDSGDNYQSYGFKLETDTRQYYTQCFLGESMRDARFIIYAYENPVPELGIFNPMSDWDMSKDYQGAEPFTDGSRPLLAETSVADIVISGTLDNEEVFIGVYPYGALADLYFEGHVAAKELACQIGTDIVNHINTNINMDIQFTDGSFEQFFTGLQMSNIRMKDSAGEIGIKNDSPELEQAQLWEVIPGTAEDSKMFYRNDAEGSLSVGYLRGDFGKGGNEFHHSWFDSENDKNTSEFKAEFQVIMNGLRKDVLKDLKSTQDFCYKHPEAHLPGDIHRYGFKVETKSRQYFVRCTVIPYDYFYVFAYDKAAAREQERQASEKPSVLKQIRDAEKAPKPPSKPKAKTTCKKKDGTEL